MSSQTFINYWIGQEPTPPSPTLDQMPAYVNVVPLAFVGIDSSYQLDFGFLTQQNSAQTIQEWIKTVRANGTRVLFSINSTLLGTVPDVPAFVANVQQNAEAWGVDGVDLDYEPQALFYNQTLIQVAQQLRSALGSGSLVTAPIWQPWLYQKKFLHDFAAQLDFVTTMDYTPYPGLSTTQSWVNQYAAIIGDPGKVAIGVSCMGPPPPQSHNFTPLADVATLSAWEPDAGPKRGMMLYTYSYDVQTRAAGGTGYPNGTFTQTIHDNLP